MTKHRAQIVRSVSWIVVLAVVLAGCGKKKQQASKEEDAAPVDPEAPAIVVAMIDAHGGMPGWRIAKTLSFENSFQMADDSVTTTSRVTVDLSTHRGYADFAQNDEGMAWDGKKAWSLNWTQPYPPTLRALLDCYMVQLPWLAMDPSAHVTVADQDTLWDSSTPYHVVKMSFRPAAPGGPYRLYIDPENKRLRACAFHAAEGEEVVVFGDQDQVEGMLLPSHYVVYSADHTPLASGTLSGWASGRPFDTNKMSVPDSARVDQTPP
jgi:hypothetical protein